MPLLSIQNCSVQLEQKCLLKNLSLEIEAGTLQAIIGPNGAGKSSLFRVLAGDPNYAVTQGKIFFKNQDLLTLSIETRAQQGLFLAFQNPCALEGVSIAQFLRAILNAHKPQNPIGPSEFLKKLYALLEDLGLDRSFASRSLNDGFSGGEKKRCELLQFLLLEPKLALLDEIDSGLDMTMIERLVQLLKHKQSQMSILLISHQKSFLKSLQPSRIHLLEHGEIVQSGRLELLDQVAEGILQPVRENTF